MNMNGDHPLRVIREEYNLSIAEVAEATTLSYRTILRAEQGHWLRPESRRLLCRFFGKTPQELGLLPQRLLKSSNKPKVSSSLAPLQATVREMLIAMQQLEGEGVNMSQSRRSFLQVLGIAGVALIAAPQELLRSPSLARASRQSENTDVSEATIENLVLITQQYRTLQRSGVATEDGLRSHIAVVQEALECTVNDARRRELWRILAQSQLLARHSITKECDRGRARTWNESAIASARYSGDSLLVGAALGHLGHLHLTWLHDPVSACQLLNQAQEHMKGHPVSGWFAMVLAAIAAEERKKQECEAWVAEATDIVHGMPETAEYSDLYFTDFNAVGVDAFAGNCLLKVGEPTKALERLTSMDLAQLSENRHASAFHDIACAYAAVNELEAMQAYTFQSIDKALATDRLYIIPRFITLARKIQEKDHHESHAAAIAEYAHYSLQGRA